jgi:hypothetical protein
VAHVSFSLSLVNFSQQTIRHTGLDCIVENLIDCLDILVGRRMHDDDDRSDKAHGATKLP